MATPVFALLLRIESGDVPHQPLSMFDPEFRALYEKYRDSAECQSRGGYTFGGWARASRLLNLPGISYVGEVYAVLDGVACDRAVRDIDFLLQYLKANPEVALGIFDEGLSAADISAILALSIAELDALTDPEGDNFHNCVRYLRDQRDFLAYVRREEGVALHLRSH